MKSSTRHLIQPGMLAMVNPNPNICHHWHLALVLALGYESLGWACRVLVLYCDNHAIVEVPLVCLESLE